MSATARPINLDYNTTSSVASYSEECKEVGRGLQQLVAIAQEEIDTTGEISPEVLQAGNYVFALFAANCGDPYTLFTVDEATNKLIPVPLD